MPRTRSTAGADGRGVVLEVVEDGPSGGPPVLLLHGFPQTSACWGACLPGLHALGARTLAYDQRGYGDDVPPDVEAYRLEHLVADAAAVLRDAAGGPAVVVGHDWGALVGWALAAAEPALVRALVAVSVPHPRAYAAAVRDDADQRARSAYTALLAQEGTAERVLLAEDARRLRGLFEGSGLDAADVERYVGPLVADGARRLTGALSWYRAVGPAQLLAVGPVRVPTTFVWSDRDVAVGRAAADRCGDHVEAPFERVDLAGVTHWVPEQAPQAVVDAVAGRLAG